MRRQLRACLIAVSLVVANMPSALATAFTFTTIDVPGAPTNSTGINDTGQIVGTFSDAAGTHGYLLSGGTFTTIDVPGAPTNSTGINAMGQIVGSFGQIEAFEPEDLHGYLANVLPKISITTNRTSFGRTDMLTVSVGVGNPGFPAVVDFYFGALLPDGHTVVFFNDLEFHSAVGDLAKPADLRPIVAGVDLATPFTFSQPTFFEYTWTGGEPSGRYLLFVAAVHPGTFADNSIDAGDIVAVSTAAVLFVTGDSSDQAADAGVLPNGRQSTGLQR